MRPEWLCLVILTGWMAHEVWADEPSRLRVAIHLHSTISDGHLEPAQIVQLAEQANLDALVLTDSALRRWEYGLWPFRNLMKRTVEQPSVLRFGASRYVERLRALQGNHQDLLVIPGVEVAPFYYWHKSPLRGQGELRNWNQHLLVMGLEASAIEELPIVSGARSFGAWGMRFLWPLLVVSLGLGFMRARPQPLLSRMGLGLVVIGMLVSADRWLASRIGFDPYQGDQGSKPYQALIDYVRQHHGLVFWAHPEMGYANRFHGIEIFTEAYPHLLETTFHYAGFAVTYFDKLELVKPGGLWDKLLLQYCRVQRSDPVWLIGELDWHDPSRRIDEVQTICRMRERSVASLLEAMGKGRCWVTLARRGSVVSLEEFSITDDAGSHRASVGETLQAGDQPLRLRVAGTYTSDQLATLTVVGDGATHTRMTISPPTFSLTLSLRAPLGRRHFYRLLLESPSALLYTNPIFVEG